MSDKLELSTLTMLALYPYIGYKCSLCEREYKNMDILVDSNPFCLKHDEEGIELACKVCFNTQKDIPISDKTEVFFGNDALSQSSEVKK